ncbi:MAG: NFACT family protein [Pyrinomonadaceae bacterium]|nr:NFACT family protein [Pyrinomonadaceae bacterium]
MNIRLLEKIVPELAAEISGRRFGRVYQLSRFEFVIDLRLNDSRFLFISIEPGDPRVYLTHRRLRDVERSSINPSPFVLQLKKLLSNAEVLKISQIAGERALKFELIREDDVAGTLTAALVIQLTGRSSNLFILNENGCVISRARETNGPGQEIGDEYEIPKRPDGSTATAIEPLPVIDGSISDHLDAEDRKRRDDDAFESVAKAARQRVDREIKKREKLLRNLDSDLAEHGDADRWKRYGDLLLANIGTATRSGSTITVMDYFDENVPLIEIEADENDSVTDAAEKYFRRYTKSRNAAEEIERRRESVERELESLRAELKTIDEAIDARDIDLITERTGGKKQPAFGNRQKQPESNGYARKFLSSDGFEILVGKKAKDNDFLTFRVARSLDTWMHAADYPGSHVVVRNQNKKEIPQRTLLEAAQLAAFYSQGKKQPKAAVHYTLKKFVNKPKGSAPGLVSLSSFKTLLVEPGVPDIERA